MIEPAVSKSSGWRFTAVLLVLTLTILLEVTLYLAGRDNAIEEIKKRGTLVVLTENNASSFYIYREMPMGFEYDLAKAFADYLGVGLDIRLPGWDRLFESLLSGEGDLIAAGLTRTRDRETLVAFSNSYLSVQQQVIVHKNNYNVRAIADLAGYTIHVRQGTTYEERLKEIQRQGLKFTIVAHRDMLTEELIRLVAVRQIPITIADSNIALLNRRYYPDAKIAFALSDEEPLAWALRPQDGGLRKAVNDFLKSARENGTLEKIYNQYYSSVNVFDYVDLKKFHRRLETLLPKYLDTIKDEAKKHDFDWRLIAAVIYQESHFNPFAISHTGVKGLMQLTDATALELGVTDRLDPMQSIKGGVKYLARLRGRFKKIANPHTRRLFTLASYNIGYGHVRDAQQIARDLGLNPNSWQALATTLPLLQDRKYYTRTRYGYARGRESVEYVNRVMTYYDILRQKSLGTNLL